VINLAVTRNVVHLQLAAIDWSKPIDKITYNKFIRLLALCNLVNLENVKSVTDDVVKTMFKDCYSFITTEHNALHECEMENANIFDFIWLMVFWQKNTPSKFKVHKSQTFRCWFVNKLKLTPYFGIFLMSFGIFTYTLIKLFF